MDLRIYTDFPLSLSGHWKAGCVHKMAGIRGREGGFPPRDEHPREKAMRSIFGECTWCSI